MSKITFRLTAATDVGVVRTNNEDNFILNKDLTQKDWFVPQDTSSVLTLGRYGCVLVVVDGMGGLNAGEVASAIAVDSVKQFYDEADLSKVIKTEASIEKFMRDIVVKADAAIKKRVKEDSTTAGMGTTLIMVWVIQNRAHLVWCGDSRAYIFNPNSGLIRFSKDHSYVQQLVDEGKLDPELAFDHPNSNIITRCLGDFEGRAKPDYKSQQLNDGDIILLCSDGLCGLCRDEEIIEVLTQNNENLEQCKLQLIKHALAAGGYDNVTVALFQVDGIEVDEDEAVTNKTLENPTPKSNKSNKALWILIVVLIVIIIILAVLHIAIILKRDHTQVPESVETAPVEAITPAVEAKENAVIEQEDTTSLVAPDETIVSAKPVFSDSETQQ